MGSAVIICLQVAPGTRLFIPPGQGAVSSISVAPALTLRSGMRTGLSKNVWKEEAGRCAGASPQPSQGTHNPRRQLTPGAASLAQHQPLTISAAPQLPMAIDLSPNHHCPLDHRMMTLPPIRDTFQIPPTAKSSPVHLPVVLESISAVPAHF